MTSRSPWVQDRALGYECDHCAASPWEWCRVVATGQPADGLHANRYWKALDDADALNPRGQT